MSVRHEVAAGDHAFRGLTVRREKSLPLSDGTNPGKTHQSFDIVERLCGCERLAEDSRMVAIRT